MLSEREWEFVVTYRKRFATASLACIGKEKLIVTDS